MLLKQNSAVKCFIISLGIVIQDNQMRQFAPRWKIDFILKVYVTLHAAIKSYNTEDLTG